MNKKVIILSLMFVLAVTLLLSAYYFGHDKTPIIVNSENTNNIAGANEKSLEWNNIALTDSTVYSSGSNICTASRLGMNVIIWPCKAQDVDGKDILQYVNFTWTGGSSQNTSWVFAYTQPLAKGKIEAWLNASYTDTLSKVTNAWLNNYLVSGVSSYTDLGTPDSRCQIGNTNNTKMYLVNMTSNGMPSYVHYCFTNVSIINSTAFRISGNYDKDTEYTVNGYRYQWVDVSDKVNYLGVGLLKTGEFSYYKVEDIKFNPSETLQTRWTYTPSDSSKKGKWHILGYDSSQSVIDSVASDKYLYIDPWWDASWSKCRNMSVTGGASQLADFPFLVNVTYSASMMANFSDIRFVNASCGNDGTEMKYELDNKVDSEHATYWVKSANLSTGTNVYSVYYGNSNVDTTASPAAVWSNNYIMVMHFSECSGTQTKDSLGINNGTFNGATWSTSGRIGCGIQNDGSTTKYVFVNHTAQLNAVRNSTVEYFVNPSVIHATNYAGIGKSGYGAGGYELIYVQGSSYAVYVDVLVSSTSPDVSAWTQLLQTWNSKTVNIYRNKIRGTSADTTSSITTTNKLYIGARDPAMSNNAGVNGLMDEVKISNVTRSSDWINRSYDNFDVSLVSFGAEQSGGGIENLIVNLLLPANDSQYSIATIPFNFTLVPSATNLTNYTTFIWYTNGSLYNKTYGTLSGNTETNIKVNRYFNLVSENYTWNVYGCSVGSTTNNLKCSWGSNLTFNVSILPTQVSLVNPPDQSKYSTLNNLLFNCTAQSSGSNIVNVTLVLNGADTKTVTNGATNYSELSGYYNTSLGSNSWYCIANSESGQATSATYSFISDNLNPNMSLINGTGTTNFITLDDYLNKNKSIAYNITDDTLDKCFVGYDSNYNISLPDGVYVYGDGSYNFLGYMYVADNTTETLEVKVPLNLDVSNPTLRIFNDTTGAGSYTELNLDNDIDTNITLNVSNGLHYVSWYGTVFGGSRTKIDMLRLTTRELYNSVYDAPCTSGAINSTGFPLVPGKYGATLIAKDQVDHYSILPISWNYNIIENSHTFSNPAYEFNIEQFVMNITYNSTLYQAAANLSYNGTLYIGSRDSNADTVTFSTNVTIPAISNLSQVNQFYWIINLINSTASFNVNSSFNNLTVLKMGIDDCSSYKNVILNMTNYDQDTLKLLPTSTFNIQLRLGDPNMIVYYQYANNFSSVASASICAQNLTSTVRMDAIIQYSNPYSYSQFYNLQNYTLSNLTSNYNLSLYDLNITSGYPFRINIKDYTYTPIRGALVQIDRQYIQNGNFLTVELPITDSSGSTLSHLVLNNQMYNIYVKRNGELLASFPNQLVYCNPTVSDCVIDYVIQESSTSPEDLTSVGGIYVQNPSYNTTTNTYSFNYVSVDQTPKTVIITGTDTSSNQQVCSQTVISTSGYVYCVIPGSYINSTILISVTSDGEEALKSYVNTGYSHNNVFSKARYIIAAMLLPALVLMTGTSAPLALLVFIIGVIICAILMLIDSMSLLATGSFTVFIAISAIILIWKAAKGGVKNG